MQSVRRDRLQIVQKKAVFLDRDGVINPLVFNPITREYESPKKLEDFHIFPGTADALQSLRREGYLIFLVSNQPDAAKGKARIEDLLQIEQSFSDFCLENGGLIDEFYYCHHHPEGIVPKYTKKCKCRKPQTGFLELARDRYNISLSDSYFIGDRGTDILCGARAGCRTVRITHPQMQADQDVQQIPDWTCSNLLEAAKWIAKNGRSEKMTQDYVANYLKETKQIAEIVNQEEIVKVVELLQKVKSNGGRLFILGVGGSAANASHAVNDFRKISGIEAYAPTDNVSELTARTNDEGWETTFTAWLKVSKLSARDALLILSVGGGSEHTSMNIKTAIDLAKKCNAKIIGIVSRDGGYTKQYADACILIPVVNENRITPHAEGWQGIVWHLIVNAI